MGVILSSSSICYEKFREINHFSKEVEMTRKLRNFLYLQQKFREMNSTKKQMCELISRFFATKYEFERIIREIDFGSNSLALCRKVLLNAITLRIFRQINFCKNVDLTKKCRLIAFYTIRHYFSTLYFVKAQ